MKKIISNLIKIYYKRKSLQGIKKFESPLRINNYCLFNSNTFLGKNTNFNGMRVEGNGRVVIGDNFHSGKECLMITSFHNYDTGGAIPYDNTYIDKSINIGDNVWIGTRVVILGGVNIGEGAIVQAGAVVVNDIPKFSIAGGNPAKSFKERDIDHYYKLKKEASFN